MSDPSRDLIGAIPPAVEKHFASITETAKLAEMLRAFEGFSGTFPVHVPLATQSVTILLELYDLTGQGRYVFPDARTAARPMSEAAINTALRRMG